MPMPSANPKIANGMVSSAPVRNPAMPPMTAPMPANSQRREVRREFLDLLIRRN